MVGYFLLVAGSCSDESLAPEEFTGCTNINACNYDIEATIDDGSCESEYDCTGLCGGNKLVDDCGICGGNNNSCTDCSGSINGTAELDNCGVCDSFTDNNCQLDCIGEWGGLSELDDCGVCGGNNSSCKDCTGMLNGTALIDECGICSDGTTGIEINSNCDDCLGVPNGDALEDGCGVCDNDYTNNCIQDCNGVWGGDAVLDECGVCNGDNSICTDCNNVINGLSFIDSCGKCIESIPESWKIEIIAELTLNNDDLDILIDGSSNYLGADILYTDGFDGIGIDIMEINNNPNPSLSFAFYHGDWEDAVFDNQQYDYFTQDIRNHNYEDFLNEGKTWNAELKSFNNYYSVTAKLKFDFIEGLSEATIIVNVVGSTLAGMSYSINDGDAIDEIIMPSNAIVNFDIKISNLCY